MKFLNASQGMEIHHIRVNEVSECFPEYRNSKILLGFVCRRLRVLTNHHLGMHVDHEATIIL